jgi:hypothetical protein
MGAARRIEAAELVPEVDLYVEPAVRTSVNVHDTFTLDVWARFSEPGSWYATDIVFEWDPTFIRLEGKTDNPLFNESFWPSHGINDTWDDGNAGYKATKSGEPISVDTWVVTLNFTALAPVSSTAFNIVLNAGSYSTNPTTEVLDAIASENCLGNLYGADVEIVPEPTAIFLLALGGLGLLRTQGKKIGY